MNFFKFWIYNITGGILWVTLFLFAGYFLAKVEWIQKNFFLDKEIAHAYITEQPDAVFSNFDIFWRFIADCNFILRKLVILLALPLKLIIASFDLLIAYLNAFRSLSDDVALLFKNSIRIAIRKTAQIK